jgi:hypothetical protein
MYAQLLSFTDVADIDDAVRFISEKMLPILRSQSGYRWLGVNTDRDAGLLSALTLWDTQSDRDAGETAVAQVLEEARFLVSAGLAVNDFEQATRETVHEPAVGNSLIVVPISMDPSDVDENVKHFQTEHLPQTRSAPGFCDLRQLINRNTGRGVVGYVWQDEQSMRAYWASCRPPAAPRPITLGEPSFRQIAFIDAK